MFSEKQQVVQMLEKRNDLIDALSNEELSKDQFIEANYQLVERLCMKPFARVTCFEHGVYNYQYYNTMAKYFLRKKCQTHTKRRVKEYDAAVRNFYFLKDQCIAQLLLFFQEHIIAYPVEVNSLRLQNQLIEIVYTNQEKIILHTINPAIKNQLITMGVFSDQQRRSLIHEYVNQTIGDEEGELWR